MDDAREALRGSLPRDRAFGLQTESLLEQVEVGVLVLEEAIATEYWHSPRVGQLPSYVCNICVAKICSIRSSDWGSVLMCDRRLIGSLLPFNYSRHLQDFCIAASGSFFLLGAGLYSEPSVETQGR